jgi:hypothetical protein
MRDPFVLFLTTAGEPAMTLKQKDSSKNQNEHEYAFSIHVARDSADHSEESFQQGQSHMYTRYVSSDN